MVLQANGAPDPHHSAVDESIHSILEQRMSGAGVVKRQAYDYASWNPLEVILDFSAHRAQHVF
jgi:hypothetical protein